MYGRIISLLVADGNTITARSYAMLSSCIWDAKPTTKKLARIPDTEERPKPYILVDDTWIESMIPKTMRISISKEAKKDERFEDALEKRNLKYQARTVPLSEGNGHERVDIIPGLKPRDSPSILDKKNRLRQLRPTQFATEIESTIYQILQEGKIAHAHMILTKCSIAQVLVNKGIRLCTVVWHIDTNEMHRGHGKVMSSDAETEKRVIIEKLDKIRPTIRYELGQRLCFRTVPELVFAGSS